MGATILFLSSPLPEMEQNGKSDLSHMENVSAKNLRMHRCGMPAKLIVMAYRTVRYVDNFELQQGGKVDLNVGVNEDLSGLEAGFVAEFERIPGLAKFGEVEFG